MPHLDGLLELPHVTQREVLALDATGPRVGVELDRRTLLVGALAADLHGERLVVVGEGLQLVHDVERALCKCAEVEVARGHLGQEARDAAAVDQVDEFDAVQVEARRPERPLLLIEPGQQCVGDSVRRDVKDDEDARGKGLRHLIDGRDRLEVDSLQAQAHRMARGLCVLRHRGRAHVR